MARYKCPSTTCPIIYTGSTYDVIPQAVAHSSGSHNINLSEQDALRIIEEQARSIFFDHFAEHSSGGERVDLEKWWKKING